MSKIVIGIPVMDKHEMTGNALSLTASYVLNQSDVEFVIVDNGSDRPYKKPEHAGGIKISLITNKTNLGYYYPLLQLYNKYPDADFIGLMHNDAAIYEDGWEQKLLNAFKNDPKLGVVGLYGWTEISRVAQNKNPFGNLKLDTPEARVLNKETKIVKRVTPALIIDSLFMVFRREVIPLLGIDGDITISHGYDKIWSLRLIEHGWRVAVLGLLFQHQGGSDKDLAMRMMFKEWFDKRWDVNSPVEYVYDIAFFETQVLLTSEFRDRKKMIPCRIDNKYKIKKL